MSLLNLTKTVLNNALKIICVQNLILSDFKMSVSEYLIKTHLPDHKQSCSSLKVSSHISLYFLLSSAAVSHNYSSTVFALKSLNVCRML